MLSKQVTRNIVGRLLFSRPQSAFRLLATTAVPDGSSITLKSASRDDSQFGTRPIYLDVQATTPTDPRVVDKMMAFYTGQYGNPHSSTHAYGWETEKEVEKARAYVADVIKADPKEIIFTSGATESNNMCIKGVPRFYKKTKNHIITTQTEHKCVLDSARHLQDEGFEVTYLPVNSEGLIDLEDLKRAIRKETCLVSVMAVNNEIGVVQPLKKIGEICRANKIFFHTDAAQAYGKIEIDVNDMNIDLLSISSHKIYGPMGIGACYVRRRPRVRLDPIITGGGQERGLRSGTLAPSLVAGFGEAARLMKQEMKVCINFPTHPLSSQLPFLLFLLDELHCELAAKSINLNFCNSFASFCFNEISNILCKDLIS